jgi:hypothetical protein
VAGTLTDSLLSLLPLLLAAASGSGSGSGSVPSTGAFWTLLRRFLTFFGLGLSRGTCTASDNNHHTKHTGMVVGD